MTTAPSLEFRIATEPWEMELVHQLNYKTFVEEIPQHLPSETPRLVDKFHRENTYLICLSGKRLVGMMAARGQRPFSLDQKLPDLDSYLPPGRRPCEIRLLAVEKEFRTGQVFRGLISLLWQWTSEHGYDMGVISGTTRQQKLYLHMGFVPFGPLVGKGDALFQPMYLTLERFEKSAEDFFRPPQIADMNFLPGPVAISKEVRTAFEQPPISHRSEAFLVELQEVKSRLCKLVRSQKVEIMLGSGTLANDTVAAQIARLQKPGLILTNGEFGDRLVDHATRHKLTFDTIKIAWGQAFDPLSIEQFLQRSPAVGWIWFVHGETSTGVLNPLPQLQDLCTKANIKLCADCISSIGVTDVDLSGIYLASGSSGKGLAAYPGLSLVFYNHDVKPCTEIPRYLDLGWYAKNSGIAFTHSSNLVRSLAAALRSVDWAGKYSEIADTSCWLRYRLRENGFDLLANENHSTPGVVTLVLPPNINSAELGNKLQQGNCLISYNSDYLRQRNWVQICLMTTVSRPMLERLMTQLSRMVFGKVEKVLDGTPES